MDPAKQDNDKIWTCEIEEERSTSLITSTRPPSAFDHLSFRSKSSCNNIIINSHHEKKQPTCLRENDHNIWGNNSNEPSSNDDMDQSQYNDDDSGPYSQYPSIDNEQDKEGSTEQQQPLIDRSLTPGQYFGARSLPLESMDEMWQPPPNQSGSHVQSPSFSSHHSAKIKSVLERDNSQRTNSWRSSLSPGIEPLWNSFKPLPTSLHHRHQWQSISPRNYDHSSDGQEVRSLRTQPGQTTPGRSRRTASYTLHPQDKVTIQCKVLSTVIHSHDGHLTLTNHHTNDTLLFSLFSAKGHVSFDVQSGSLDPGQVLDIWIRPNKRILQRTLESDQVFDESLAVLIGQDLYRLAVDLDITLDEDPDDLGTHPPSSLPLSPKTNKALSTPDDSLSLSLKTNKALSTHDQDSCPFCVLEILYPLSL